MPAPAPSAGDPGLLDELLERFLVDIAEARPIDVAAALPDRPDLAERVRETLALAQSIAVQRPVSLPRIPGFRILSELGRGGMGTVYLALQENLGRRVALKTMLSARLSGARARARFEREVRAIARLQHQNIVPVYETGEVEGIPFFTMEYVEGRSLSTALGELKLRAGGPAALLGADLARAAKCPEHAIPPCWSGSYVEAVVRLLADVADALAHAHAHGIVHRDLKPANILVRGDGRPLLVDFGLAQVDDEAGLTVSGDFVGTPHYSSPEQLDPRLGTVDARTDVYALGVTLYELLTLDVPFRGSSTHGVRRAMFARAARSPRQINAQVPRDLETICLTALEQEPARRYASAAAFAEDLRRLLQYRPIAARPAGTGTRVRRWIQRNPARAAALALATMLLLGAPTALWLQQSSANRRIQAEADRFQEVVAFHHGILESADPAKKGRDAKMIDLLADARQQLHAKFAKDPEIRATLLETIGESYFGLGMAEEAESVFAEAVGVRAAYDPTSPDALMARLWVAAAKMELGQVEPAETMLHEVIAIARRVHGPSAATTLTGRFNLAKSLVTRGELVAALPLAIDVVERRVGTLMTDHEHTLVAKSLVAWIQCELGKLDLAEPAYRELIDIHARRFSLDHVETLKLRNNHAGVLLRMGRADLATEIIREVFELRQRQLSNDHPLTVHTAAALGECLRASDRLDEAQLLLDRALTDARRLLVPDHWILLDILYKHGNCLLQRRQFTGAEQSARELEDASARARQPNHRQIVAAAYLRARIADGRGDLVEGERRYRNVLARAREHLSDRDPLRWSVQTGLGQFLVRQGSLAEAERLLLESHHHLLELTCKDNVDVATVRSHLVQLYEARNEPERAAEYRPDARRSVPNDGRK